MWHKLTKKNLSQKRNSICDSKIAKKASLFINGTHLEETNSSEFFDPSRRLRFSFSALNTNDVWMSEWAISFSWVGKLETKAADSTFTLSLYVFVLFLFAHVCVFNHINFPQSKSFFLSNFLFSLRSHGFQKTKNNNKIQTIIFDHIHWETKQKKEDEAKTNRNLCFY